MTLLVQLTESNPVEPQSTIIPTTPKEATAYLSSTLSHCDQYRLAIRT